MKIATIYDYRRMCDFYNGECADCPLFECLCNTDRKHSSYQIDEANDIILKWCEKHPGHTRQSEFLKLFPDAQITDAGVIKICPKEIDSWAGCDDNCFECKKEFWLQEIE